MKQETKDVYDILLKEIDNGSESYVLKLCLLMMKEITSENFYEINLNSSSYVLLRVRERIESLILKSNKVDHSEIKISLNTFFDYDGVEFKELPEAYHNLNIRHI